MIAKVESKIAMPGMTPSTVKDPRNWCDRISRRPTARLFQKFMRRLRRAAAPGGRGSVTRGAVYDLDLSAVDFDAAQGVVGDVAVLGDEGDATALLAEFAEEQEDARAGSGVEVAGRPVGKNDLWIVHERARWPRAASDRFRPEKRVICGFSGEKRRATRQPYWRSYSPLPVRL